MLKFVATIAAALCAICAQPVLAADASEFQLTPANVKQAESVAQRVAKELSPLFDREIQVAVIERREATPMASTVSKLGTCIIIINKTSAAWRNWALFYTRGQLTAEEIYEFAAVHEVAHCVNKQFTNNAPMKQLSEGRDSETYADLFALTHLAQSKQASDMKRIVDSVIHIREGFSGFFAASHSTSGAIKKVYAELLDAVPAGRNLQQTLSQSINLFQKAA